MCNICNSNTTANSTLWNGQRICRDYSGNVWVRVSNGCSHQCCGCHCGCHCGCGCSNGNNSSTSGNNNGTNGNNGNFTCVTFCGNTANATTQTTGTSTAYYNADAYYARQYGSTYGGRSSGGCGCGRW